MESEEQKFKDTLWNREIKQENDFLENVKEDPVEVDEHSGLIIPKQETEESLKNIKTEPIVEENSERIIPKFEEVQEQSTSYVSDHNIQNIYITKINVEPRRKSTAHRCVVCLQICPRQNMKFMTMKEEKLVIMVGCVLHGNYTLDQARLFMSGRERGYICHIHFSEATNKIYEDLNIEDSFEITSCSIELMDSLMITVNALYPQIKTSQFCDIFYKFVRRNMPRKRERIITKGEQNKKQPNYLCSVCTEKQSSTNIKRVKMETAKLVLMVGCLLRGEVTIKKAQFIVSMKSEIYVCHIHFSEALTEIYKTLNIKNPDEVSLCSEELLANLMATVNQLCPQFEPWQFRTSLKNFFTKNKHVIRNVEKD